MITAILNGYRRPEYLNEQIKALKNQTIPPTEILFWYNNPMDGSQMNYEISNEAIGGYSNNNFGVWARFYFALNAKNPFVCIFDDDTIPGPMWFENCINTMNQTEGLLGTVGLLYDSHKEGTPYSYVENYVRYGWCNPNENTIQVDLVGHAWFFKKEWLSYMFRELPDPKYATCGEDMHFSYMLQKYANIPTYVPPHPRDKPEMWGSLKGSQYGDDPKSLWHNNPTNEEGRPFRVLMNEYFVNQRTAGWKIVREL